LSAAIDSLQSLAADVSRAGGSRDLATMKQSYQQADPRRC
jgi:hypothetical protein